MEEKTFDLSSYMTGSIAGDRGNCVRKRSRYPNNQDLENLRTFIQTTI